MGIWDLINSSTEAVKRNAPDLTTVKNACTKINNVVGQRSLRIFNRYGANSNIGIATNIATNAVLALHESYRSDPVVDTAYVVWISVCFPIKYEQSIEGVWKWKYTEYCKGKTTPILVLETISYEELYDKVKEVLKIDTKLYKIEMSALVPIMREAPAAPIIIDCDNNVKWFVTVCKETFLCISISNEVVENHQKKWI